MENDEREKIIQEFLKQENIDKEERKIIINLYLFCKKLDKFRDTLKNNNQEIFQKLEEKIYQGESNEPITDIDKINLEILYYQSLKNPHNLIKLNNIKELIYNKKNNLSKKDINLLKEKIVELQILNNNDITFYNSSYDLLDKKLIKIKEKIKRG